MAAKIVCQTKRQTTKYTQFIKPEALTMSTKLILAVLLSVWTHTQANASTCMNGQLLVPPKDLQQAQRIARDLYRFISDKASMITVGEGTDTGFAGYNYEPAIEALQNLTPDQRKQIVGVILDLRNNDETIESTDEAMTLLASLKAQGLQVPAEFEPLVQIGKAVLAKRLAPSQPSEQHSFSYVEERSRRGLLPEGEGPQENYPYVEHRHR